MDVLSAVCWMLFPLLCNSLPSRTGEGITDETMHVLPPSKQDETVCGASAGTSWGNLETFGYLRKYEIAFLDSVKQQTWERHTLFGMCPEENFSALMALKELSTFLADPQGKQLVVMHIQKVELEPGFNMQFHVSVQDHLSPILQHLHVLIGVFYPDIPKTLEEQSKIMLSGEAVSQPQVACMSSETRYLVLKLKGTVKRAEPGNLKLQISFDVKRYPGGLTLSATESEQHLFGSDEKCSTRVTPVILMVVGHHAHSGTYPSTLHSNAQKSVLSTEDTQMLVASKKQDEFTENLSSFATLLMTANGKASSTIYLPLDPYMDYAGGLQPQLLNFTEMEAFEWLLKSKEPLVFLLSPGGKNVLASRVQATLNETLLERIKDKIEEVLEDLKEMLSTSKHLNILDKLLQSCYGNFNISYLNVEEKNAPQFGEGPHWKLHSLMLLKTLQTIQYYWQDRKTLSRQNREAGLKPYCRLQELTISLKLYSEYKDIFLPQEININNCVGPCNFPQTTRGDYQAHVILLIKLQEKSQSGIDRQPCCVPVRYEEQWLMVADENGLRLKQYPNMVAKECGCR